MYVKNRTLIVNTFVFFECGPEILGNSEEFFLDPVISKTVCQSRVL